MAPLFVDNRPAFQSQHAWQRRAVQVHVHQAYLETPLGQAQGQLAGHGGLAHPALAAHHQQFAADVVQGARHAGVQGIQFFQALRP